MPRSLAKTTPTKKSSNTHYKGPVTLAMVAHAAGVSASTVSRILNGTAVVSTEKRAAIDKAIAELGFAPNPMARGLAGGKSLSIGVVTQSIDSPFYGVALRGIEQSLGTAGYSPLFVSGHWNEKEEAQCIDMLLARRVDGVIVLTGRLSDAALKGYAKRVPVVVTGRNLSGRNLYSLNFDNANAARMATQHLIELGHRRIAFIQGDMAHPDAQERFAGYQAAHTQAQLPLNPELIFEGLYNEESGIVATEQLIQSRKKCTAIFAANDQMALGAALVLHRHRIAVPSEISLVGFDDMPMSAFANPPLTTIHQPAFELGQLAANAVLQLIQGAKPKLQLPSPRLVLRESTQKLLR